MIEVKNKMKSPIQLMVKSWDRPRSFTTLIVPGIGSGKNVVLLKDESRTEYWDRFENNGMISTRYIPNNEIRKGD